MKDNIYGPGDDNYGRDPKMAGLPKSDLDAIKKILKTLIMTRAKFKVDELKLNANGGEIKMSPVTSGSIENEEFFKWTPYGSLVMGTVNDAVLKQFLPGDEFYLDFTPVPKPDVTR